MDQKTWIWRKKASEKIILSTDKVDLSVEDNKDEIQTLVEDRRALENELKILNNKLSSALSECNSKDEFVKKHEKMAMEAVVGKEKVEVEAVLLKQERDEALQMRVACEERLTRLDAALKECMQQLRFVREEQERRIHDAVTKASNEFEKSQKTLEARLAESSKRVTKLVAEHTNLSKALLAKEKLIDDLYKLRAQMETDFNALMTRVESTEKDNASLKYEVRVLEKELEIRNEEREFNRQTSEASHKQHLESVKKIAKMESECQRLRLLVRKRLPGPAALAKMKNEVEMLGKDSIEMSKRRLDTSPGQDFVTDSYSDSPRKRINILNEQLCAMEEENKALKEALNEKTSELQFSRVMYARTASKLSEVETQIEESAKSEANSEATRNIAMPHEVSLASMFDVGSNRKAGTAESWASEQFKNRQTKESLSRRTVGSSEINLMDDFVEMEKLALVSVDQPSVNSHVSSNEANRTLGPLQPGSSGNSLEVMCMEIVPVTYGQSDQSLSNNETKSQSPSLSNGTDWLREILKVILEQSNATQRNPDEILEDIRKALACMNYPNTGENFYEREGLDHPSASGPSCISGYFSWKPSNGSSQMDLSNRDADVNICSEDKSNQQFHPDLSKSICRIIELIEGINISSADNNIPESLFKGKNSSSHKHSETPSGYTVHVYQWKASELDAVLQQFVRACHELLNGKTGLNKFIQELTSALDWIINHYFSLQHFSSIRDAIKKHFDRDEVQSETEAEVGIVSQFAEADKLHFTVLNGNNDFLQKEHNVKEENQKLRDELEAEKKHLEDKLQSTTNRSDSLSNQLEESEKTIANMQAELDTLRRTHEMDEGRVQKQQSINKNLNNQLSLTKIEQNEAREKFHSQDLDSENKNYCHEELEVTCIDSVTEKEISNSEIKKLENQFRTDWEIAAASEKLAECQETILNLGKQLKALASPKESVLFDKVVPTPTETITPTSTAIPTPSTKTLTSQRYSLLDQMIAEDNAEPNDLVSPKTKEKVDSDSSFLSNRTVAYLDSIVVSNGDKHQDDNAAVKSLAIVPSKKQGVSLWKKLLWRKTKSKSKKTSLPFAA
ncbi:filament-like plant protein 7 [Hibiscus syriacus]|uniref:filament-like plant protein 7 n=1 Tax=Hibiscus syriacus TaxID=106335 RepID=UPI001920E65E|nr:filament-like plant protein 7 [Hibiscus syriacus]